jgi:hypothetical protein
MLLLALLYLKPSSLRLLLSVDSGDSNHTLPLLNHPVFIDFLLTFAATTAAEASTVYETFLIPKGLPD